MEDQNKQSDITHYTDVTFLSNYSEEEHQAALRVKKWILSICRNKECCAERIFISSQHKGGQTRTIICIADNLPLAPLVTIPKAVNQITLEDVLCCYTKVNCSPE
jgi:hypothetical protein